MNKEQIESVVGTHDHSLGHAEGTLMQPQPWTFLSGEGKGMTEKEDQGRRKRGKEELGVHSKMVARELSMNAGRMSQWVFYDGWEEPTARWGDIANGMGVFTSSINKCCCKGHGGGSPEVESGGQAVMEVTAAAVEPCVRRTRKEFQQLDPGPSDV